MVEFPQSSWKDYELLDCGGGEKLERFGGYVLARPEPKALWGKSMSQAEWDRLAHTRFKPGAGFGKAGKEDSGTWEQLRRMDGQWWIRYPLGGGIHASDADVPVADGRQDMPSAVSGSAPLDLRLGLTSFKHVGLFPEQAPNWEFIYRMCRGLDKPRVLNLFAYTGAASLAARAAGAEVTHLDSVKQVVTWARGNMERSGMDGIRWIVEDAMKFALREERRGNLYDGIILDPPAYGHGPDGEKWKLDECLFDMLRSVSRILKPSGSFMVLNLYSNGYSAALGETLVREAFGLKSSAANREAADSGSLRGTPLSPLGVQGDRRSSPEQEVLGADSGSLRGTPLSPLGVQGDNMSSPELSSPELSSGELALRDRFGKVLPLSIVVRLELP